MKNRPFLLIFIGLLHFIEPFIKIIYLKVSSDFGWITVLNNVFSIEGFKANFDFWILFPITGLAIILITEWSYMVVWLLEIYHIALNISYESYTWPYVGESPHVTTIIILSLNFTTMLLFLFPQIRYPYLNKHVRWWEPKKRFFITIPVVVEDADFHKICDAEILNISRSGVFINNNSDYSVDSIVHLNFTFKGLTLRLQGQIKSLHSLNGIDGVGIKFKHSKLRDFFDLYGLIKRLESLKIPHNKIG